MDYRKILGKLIDTECGLKYPMFLVWKSSKNFSYIIFQYIEFISTFSKVVERCDISLLDGVTGNGYKHNEQKQGGDRGPGLWHPHHDGQALQLHHRGHWG